MPCPHNNIDLRHPITVCKASAGTGKTFTLAAYYIGLLMSGESYQSILAITFTNKATAEMRERILTYLYDIWQGTADANFIASVRSFMFRNRDKGDQWFKSRAEDCFRQMLADFDNVKIQTIDSFLQALLSGLAGMLHQSAGQETELDTDRVITEAVDQLLTSEMTDDDIRIMRNYLNVRLDQDEKVYIRANLIGLAKELYNESVQMMEAKGQIVFDTQRIAARRERIAAKRENSLEIVGLRTELEQKWQELSNAGESDRKGVNQSLNPALKNIRTSLDDPGQLKKSDRFRGLTDDAYQAASQGTGGWAKVPSYISRLAADMTDTAHRCRAFYATIDLTTELSHEMQLMSSLQRVIQRNLAESNRALLSRTAGILNSALRDGDADFILEKAGIRYHHVLMDEFQDTSKLQWSVVVKLLQDLVAGEGNTLLIVGDIKQSIYRWRNGDWHIMDELTNEESNTLTRERLNPRFRSLQKNFRSSEEVVRFNLSLFQYVTDHYPQFHDQLNAGEQDLIRRIYDESYDGENLEPFYQSQKKRGGYVRFRALETKDECLTQMFDAMEQLLCSGVHPADMMVLVRRGAEAQWITSEHACLNEEDYPNLSQASFVSASSFQLDASEAVNTIIAALRLVENSDDRIAAHQIELAVDKPGAVDLIRKQISRRMPLYEAVCELVKILLTDDGGQYTGQETAYINDLLDRTRDYVRSFGSDIRKFLQYWDDTMHSKSIPTFASGAIRIMTIHKSKGLQAQTVFIPFCNWPTDDSKSSSKIWSPIASEFDEGDDYIPISDSSMMYESAYREQYMQEHMDLRIDSLNMLYVALTRAEDNLFVFTDYKLTQKGKAPGHVGSYLVAFVDQDYEAGSVVVKPAEQQSGTDQSRPFAFDDVPTRPAELWANSEQVRFVQSQEGALYADYGEDAYRRVARMEEGTLCHEIFANIRNAGELDAVLDDFETRGEIRDKTQREELRKLISSAWEGNEQMRSWFVDPWELKLETGILVNDREVRPDRVMIDRNTNNAIVLDYKFGQWNKHYITQVQQYMATLRNMGHPQVEGYLWFARENRLIEVKDERMKG